MADDDNKAGIGKASEGTQNDETNAKLAEQGTTTGNMGGGAGTGADKQIRELDPKTGIERKPGESDEDFAARAEAASKRSPDTASNMSQESGDNRKGFNNDSERRAAASDEQKQAWHDQRNPLGSVPGGVRNADQTTTEAQRSGAEHGADERMKRGRFGQLDEPTDEEKRSGNQHYVYERIKDLAGQMAKELDRLSHSAETGRARAKLDEITTYVREHVGADRGMAAKGQNDAPKSGEAGLDGTGKAQVHDV